MSNRDEPAAEVAVKERYERPLLLRHGPLRDVTGQVSNVVFTLADGVDGGADD